MHRREREFAPPQLPECHGWGRTPKVIRQAKVKLDPISQRGRAWVFWADYDWVAARVIYLQQNPKLWMPAGLLAHKAIEQYMKAFLRCRGSKTEWSGPQGHNLSWLGTECACHEPFFSHDVMQHRLQVFHDIYRAWRYPKDIIQIGCSGESLALGSSNLTLLDETVSEIRPRINLATLGLPPTFREAHELMHEGPHFIELASRGNDSFRKMEEFSAQRNPRPTWEELSQ